MVALIFNLLNFLFIFLQFSIYMVIGCFSLFYIKLN